MKPEILGLSLGIFSYFIIITIYLTLYYKTKEQFLKTWSIAVSIALLRFLINIIQNIYGRIFPLELTDSLISAVNPLLYSAGVYQLKRKKFPRVFILVTILICIWIIYSSSSENIPLIFRLLPNAFFTSFLFASAGFMFFGLEGRSVGKKITRLSLILWGIHRAAYPFIISIEWAELSAYFIYFAIGISAAVGVVIYYFQVINQQLKQSNQFLEIIAENADDIIFHYRFLPSRKLEFVSPSCNKILGYNQEEFYNDPELILKIIHPDDKHLFDPFEKDFTHPVIMRFNRRNGSVVWLETKISAVKNEKGVILFIEGISRDVTERIDFQKKITESEELYRLMFNLSSAVMLLIDAVNGKIFDANKAACDFYGYSKAQLLHKYISEINTIDDFKNIREEIKIFGSRHFITKHRLASGENRDVEVYTAYEIIGNRELFYSVIHDITEAMKVEEALKENEIRYRTMFEDSSAVMLLIDPVAGKIWDANKAACEFYGYTREEFAGKYITDYNKSLASPYLEKFISQVKSGEINYRQYKHMLSDGKLVDVEVHVSVIVIKGKELFFSIVHDISDRLKIEMELERHREHLEDIIEERTLELSQSEERFRRVAENSDDSIIIFDKDLTVQYINPIVEKRNPWLYDNILGKKPANFGTPGPLTDEIENTLKKVLETRNIITRDFTLPDKRVVEFLVLPVLDDNKREVEMLMALGRDVTQRKKLEESLHEALEKEKEINELKTQLVSTVSHEFRTPLAGILSSAELLERYGRKWDEEKYHRYIDKIRHSVNNLTLLMEDVLTLGRVESKKIEFKPADIDLNLICNELLEEAELIASEKHKIEFIKNIVDDIYKTDERLFRLIFSNLLSNAIKYSPDGGKVIFKVSESDKEMLFEISDEGIGIPEDDMKTLYDPFFRGNSVKHIPGTGLGLPIVKEAVELYNGKIQVTSEVNKGTTFYVTLPKIIFV
ncbi:MAG: PAS domain S-box protein [Ignavibacteria bacterium]